MKLSIGTAQFGMDYGITSTIGPVNIKEIKEVFSFALEHKIISLDTAYSYGDSEYKIGQCIGKDKRIRITTKLPSLPAIDPVHSATIYFQESLDRLATSSVDTLLVHNPSNLKGKHPSSILDWMKNLRSNGIINNIGISIYDHSDLSGINLDDIDIIQLPLSLYDQRNYKDMLISNLKSEGKYIVTRSSFLQGLILTEAEKWPTFLSRSFITHHHNFLNLIQKMTIQNPLFYALDFISRINEVDQIVVGIHSLDHLREIYNYYSMIEKSCASRIDYSTLAWDNMYDIDPRFWRST
ncbi:conserved hypothetical protein [Synechococcus sp. CC9902]|uniref:aldo/keto reductase n=1 Tax=Synechococcus sp. (strain CC9902) TaxID=316279 RepID=UPI00005D3CF4|nr:aldo/keto reductase [Synechococcus sp. CC9902]ABB25066.1 conserved hypothetical protein [Synechococcus sp. CC9902]